MLNRDILLFLGLSRTVTSKISETHRFIINSHLPVTELQDVVKTHEVAIAAAGASISFYRTLTLGSFVVTVISGFSAGAIGSNDRSPLVVIAIIAGIVFTVSAITWRIKSLNYSHHQYWSNCYTRIIDAKQIGN